MIALPIRKKYMLCSLRNEMPKKFGRGTIGIDDGMKPRRRMTGDVGRVDRADAPGAELAEIDHP